MTELQVTINNLKEGVIAAELMIETLEKTKESEPHKWEHGDVFQNEFGVIMIHIRSDIPNTQNVFVFCISGACDCYHKPSDFLKHGRFLFNIKEKL